MTPNPPRDSGASRPRSRRTALAAFLIAAWIASGAGTAAAQPATPDTVRGDLGPTTAVPWNPDRPMNPRRGWEQALLLPGRIASLPLVGLGRAADHALLAIEQRALLPRATNTALVVERTLGLKLSPAQLGDRTGLGGAVELRTPYLGGALRNRASVQLSGSTRKYSRARFSAYGNPMILQYTQDWRPEERWYGLGQSSRRDSLSDYALHTESLEFSIRHEWNHEDATSLPRTMIRVWAAPRFAITRTGREDGNVSFDQRFPALGAALLDRGVEHLTYGIGFRTDWRLGQPHWSEGWRVLMSAERFDRPIRALALRVGEPRGAQFTRYEIETETGFSFYRDPRTLRFLARFVDQEVHGGGGPFLLTDLSRLGGSAGLYGFDPGRFQDLDLVLGRVSYIYPLLRRFEVDLHSEWGAVYPDLWEHVKPNTLAHSYGIALRARTDQRPFGTIGVDLSRDRFRIRYSLGGVE